MYKPKFRLIKALLVGVALLTLMTLPLVTEENIGESRYACFSRLSRHATAAESFTEFLGPPLATERSWRGEICKHYDLTRHTIGTVCPTNVGARVRSNITIFDPSYGPLKALWKMYEAFFRHMTTDANLFRCLEADLGALDEGKPEID